MSLIRSHGRLLTFGLTAVTIVSTLAGTMMSLALFTDQADVDDNNFSTGTIDISATPSTALFTVSDMLPGDIAGPYALTVSNDGSVSLDYTMSTSATNVDTKNLRDQLTLVIRAEDVDGACDDFDGTSLYNGALSSGAVASRTLASSADEVLCFRVELPSATDNTYQGASTTATFTFAASQ
jgi:predicted ribosomally synthesized peptide with SipW-like signal peptide